MMEHLCHSFRETYRVRATVVRLFSVYGAGLKKQLLWDLCSRLSTGENPVRLGGTGAELRDWTDVTDLAAAMSFLLAYKGECSPVLNIGTGTATSVKSVTELVLRAWPRGAEATFSGTLRAGDPFSLVASAQRLADMGFQWQTPVDRGVADYVSWFLQHSGRRLS
jgi:UDP-glucose 4-epimerase